MPLSSRCALVRAPSSRAWRLPSGDAEQREGNGLCLASVELDAGSGAGGTLVRLIADAGLTPRQAAREKGTPFVDLGLGDPGVSDDQILDAMLAHPILINRPFVVTERGTRLCRPSEVLLRLSLCSERPS
jgi:arsenate reductase (glutaredoxin)